MVEQEHIQIAILIKIEKCYLCAVAGIRKAILPGHFFKLRNALGIVALVDE
ncbi:hypothetical protein D3C86_2242170 [compost metagenome]